MRSSRFKKTNLKWKYILLLLISGFVISFDQWTKSLITEKFFLGESISIISNFFNLTYVQNKGAAFGLLAQAPSAFRGPFFVLVPLIALGTIAYIFKKLRDQDRLLVCAFSLVVGGAIGNLIDRLSLGYVVDFLDFHWRYTYHFPAFNVADSSICVGVGILMLDLFISQEGTLMSKKEVT